MLVKKIPSEQPKDFCKIWLDDKLFAMVDKDDFEKFGCCRWKPRKSRYNIYAVRRVQINGKVFNLKLHREIMNTPPDEDCHHRDRNSLNCCKSNLVNMNKTDHQLLHAQRINHQETTATHNPKQGLLQRY
jgi:hypothetical protein